MRSLRRTRAMEHVHDRSDFGDPVMRFVSTRAGVNRKELTLDTTLLGDLGIDGDDAHELFEDFEARFKVDLREFQILRCFHSEVELFAEPLDVLRWVMDRESQNHPNNSHKIPITIAALIRAAARGCWEHLPESLST